MKLNCYIVHAKKWIAGDIQDTAKMRVTNMEEGKYIVDMIDLLEVIHHLQKAYNVEPYSTGLHYPCQQSLIEMGIVYMGCCIKCVAIHLLHMVQVSDWPEQWFQNLSMDLKELNNLLLLLVCRQSPPPPLPACYHAYVKWKDDEKAFQNELQQIPMDAFCLLDSINTFIPAGGCSSLINMPDLPVHGGYMTHYSIMLTISN
ncbi:hypothetical protein EDC04DRAFT_2604506 [Pisolithus marmoratus]|nr:hypothetical protein EDC04DRAFT_2604506 [Pisolithus marmoratus]